jgi:hypothetical protein
MTHCIGPYHTDVVEVFRLLSSHSSDLFGHKVNQLVSNFHA